MSVSYETDLKYFIHLFIHNSEDQRTINSFYSEPTIVDVNFIAKIITFPRIMLIEFETEK